jgi:hypothetical protein
LYVNVSDAWLLRDRRQRIVISGAGIGVEVVLASAATIVWWATHAGWLHDFCWSLMLVGSVNTVLFNGNPLLRYDGYYVLSDLVRVPNLFERSRRVLHEALLRFLFGVSIGDGPGGPVRRPIMLGGYAVASTVYRGLLVIVILVGLNGLLQARGLSVLGHVMTLMVVGGIVVPGGCGARRMAERALGSPPASTWPAATWSRGGNPGGCGDADRVAGNPLADPYPRSSRSPARRGPGRVRRGSGAAGRVGFGQPASPCG